MSHINEKIDLSETQNQQIIPKKKHGFTKEERKQCLKARRQKKQEQKAVGFHDNDLLKQTSYYFENGLRKVYPYFFGWNTTAKERWFKRTLVDIYKNEFTRAIVNQSIEKLIESGKIRVNGQIKSLNYLVKNGDKLSHIKHRHEIPVLDDKIKIIYEDNDYLVVDKPCSIPMHPCGKYRYNSLSIILAKELGYSNLRTMYRLDRLTSGLVILGKNFKAALLVDKHIKERTANKTYLCKVNGEFPAGRIEVNKGIDCASRKIGLYWLDDEKGKESITEFERLSYNGKTSIVYCYPKTGRTHQIRIHLQYLGFPILNDPLYNQPTVWGKTNGKDGKYEFTKEEIEKNFLNVHTYEAWIIKQEQNDDDRNEEDKDEEKPEKKSEKTISCKEQQTSDDFVEKPNELIMNKDSEKEEEEVQSKRKTDNIEKEADIFNKKIKIDIEDSIKKSANTTEVKNEDENKVIEDFDDFKRPKFNPSLLEKDEDCFECSQVFRDPNRKDLIMYLHALSYKFGDLEFKTEMPKWVENDDDE